MPLYFLDITFCLESVRMMEFYKMTDDSVINKFDIQLALTTSIMGSNIILTPFKKKFFFGQISIIDTHD